MWAKDTEEKTGRYRHTISSYGQRSPLPLGWWPRGPCVALASGGCAPGISSPGFSNARLEGLASAR